MPSKYFTPMKHPYGASVTSQFHRSRIDGNTDRILDVNANFESTDEFAWG
jgi:hypothetical protein